MAAFVVFVAMQVIPYGRDHLNPPLSQEPQWDNPRTRQLFFPAHSEAQFSEFERAEYIRGLVATFGEEQESEEGD